MIVFPMTPMVEVAKRIKSTAIYPREFATEYVDLGLFAECGEVANKWKKVYRDEPGAQMTLDRLQGICDEMGDVFWYLVMAVLEGYCNFHEVDEPELDVLFGDRVLNFIQPGIGHPSLRDIYDHGSDTLTGDEEDTWKGFRMWMLVLEELRNECPEGADDQTKQMWVIATEPSCVVTRMLEKLESRKERGVLQGSGDNR